MIAGSRLKGIHMQTNRSRNQVPPPDSENLIDLRSIRKVYQTAAGEFEALKDVNLTVRHGEFVAVIGKSGSGKSTLINMITGIDKPTSGESHVSGAAVHTLNENQVSRWRGENLGIVFQFFQLLPSMSIAKNVMLPMDFCNKYTRKERYERALMLLDLVGLSEQAHKRPTQVSGGQQQRVAIARALANDPNLIVADEPTGSLDSKTANQIFELFETLVYEHGKTILIVTHDEEQARRVQRTVLIVDGEVVNEYLARALPTLGFDTLKALSHELEPHIYQSGETILSVGEQVDRFYIVSRGHADVYLTRPYGSDVYVDRFQPGHFFGEMELLHGTHTRANIIASGDEPVEVMSLSRERLLGLLDESQATRAMIETIMSERIESGGQAVLTKEEEENHV